MGLHIIVACHHIDTCTTLFLHLLAFPSFQHFMWKCSYTCKGCLSSLVGKIIAWKVDGCRFKSHLSQPIFLTVWGELCCILLCLSVVLFLASLGVIVHEKHVHSTLAKQEKNRKKPTPLTHSLTYTRVGHWMPSLENWEWWVKDLWGYQLSPHIQCPNSKQQTNTPVAHY